jgi:hypothetical protein
MRVALCLMRTIFYESALTVFYAKIDNKGI